MNQFNNDHDTLPMLRPAVRSLYTGYLLVIGIGLLMAGTQILLTHGMADGKFGVSINDIVFSYYGDRSNSKLETKLNGSMQDKASDDVKRAMIMWAQQGADKGAWDDRIGELFQQNCVMCHSVIPAIPNFKTYEGVLPSAAVDEGETIGALARVSHIHLFGIAFIFFFVGYIFSQAVGYPPLLQGVLIFTPFAFLIIDVLSWWLTKWYPNFAVLTIIGGVGYSLASTIMIVSALYQMWIMPIRNRVSSRQAVN